MSNIIIFFLIFILPFIIAPFGITQFEDPKVILAEIGIIILLIVWVFSGSTRISLKSRRYFLYFAIFILTFIDAVFFRTQLSFLGNAFRMQGIFLLWFMLLFSFLSARVSFEDTHWSIYAILLASELIAIFFLSVNETGRYVGTLGEPNATAAFVIFLWPFILFSIKKFGTLEKISATLVSLVIIIILILTNSRSAMVAFGIQLLFIFLQRKRVSIARTTIICLFVYLLSYSLPFFDHAQFENRVQIWQSAIWSNNSNIIFGQGFGNLENALHASAHRLNLLVQYSYVDSAHNIFLDWWVQGGIAGITIIISLIYLAFIKFTKENNRRELVLLFGMLTVLSFNPASIAGLLGFWWLMGQTAS